MKGAVNTQAIIATHDPLVINGVNKDFIKIFTLNNGEAKVVEPSENTEGLGIDGLLQSEYYGLPSVLDKDTKNKMLSKQSLLIKKIDGTITETEKDDLQKLSEELENMAFARNIPTDSYYDEYVAAMHRIYKEKTTSKVLTAADIAERNDKAEDILRGLLPR